MARTHLGRRAGAQAGRTAGVVAASRGRPGRTRGDRGFVLVVVLFALGLLALIATAFSLAVRGHLKSTLAMSSGARAEALADGGVAIAVQDLLSSREDRTRKRRFALDGTAIWCALGDGGRLRIAVQDEAGRIDLNTASETLVRALLRGAGLDADAAAVFSDRLLDYRDRDATRRPQGAERGDYRAAGLPDPKNGPLDAIEELGQILGADARLLNRLRPWVTVHSGLGGLDPRVAPAGLVALLGEGGPSRPSPSGSAGAGGPTGGASTGSDAARTPQPAAAKGVTRPLPASVVEISPQQVFAITSDAETPDGARFVREAVVDLGLRRAPAHVFKRWRRGVVAEEGAAPGVSPDAGALPPC